MSVNCRPVDGEYGEILKKTFTNKIRKGYVIIKDTVLTQRYADMAEDVLNFEVRNSDLWVCSFPKSGTTWTQEMCWLIANDCDFKAAEENLGARFPFLELSSIFDYRDILATNKEFNPPPFLEDSISYLNNVESPRLIKTHVPWDLLPLQIQNKAKQPKIIYVARNPKDTCISYYHHCIALEGYKGNLDEFCKLFLAGKVTFAPYWSNILPFWERRNETNILFLKYEDMIKDLPGVIQTVSNFLGKKINDRQMEKLVHHLSFESMKNNKSVNYLGLIELNKKFGLINSEGCFMRAGMVGSYKESMKPEVIKQFDEWTEEHTRGTGLFFDV